MKTALSYLDACFAASQISSFIHDDCKRIQIAGSIRRGKPTIGDIEIVCIPKHGVDLFGDPTDEMLLKATLEARPELTFMKGQDRQRVYLFTMPDGRQVQLDLFITTPEKWGMILVERTGSADFSRRLVTQKMMGGKMPNGMYTREGRLWRNDKVLDTSTEEKVFEELGLDWVAPENRI